jgi:hypothetical protein
MKTKFSLLLALIVTGTVSIALAQGPYPRDGYGNPGYNNRGYSGGYRDYDRGGYGRSNGTVIDRVMGDLSQTGSYGWMDGRDRKHINHAQDDLMRFQEKWSRGRFDRGRLDRAIDNLQHVVNSSRLDPRRRDRLASDLYDLRDFRNRGSYNGGYYGGRPY